MTRKDRFYQLILVGFLAGTCIIAPQIRAAEPPRDIAAQRGSGCTPMTALAQPQAAVAEPRSNGVGLMVSVGAGRRPSVSVAATLGAA